MKRFTWLACLIALAFAGCRRKETRVEEGNRLGILHVGNGGEPADLDPQTIIGAFEGDIATALFESLVQLHHTTLAPIPAACTGWDVSPDGRRYTFHLRPEAKWSNGDPVRSADWVFTFQRLLSPRLAAPFSNYATNLVGAGDYLGGKTRDFSTVGVRAVDPLTLEFTLVNPAPYFPTLLSFFPLYPVHPPTIRKFEATERAGTAWTRAGNLVSNGPFLLKEWLANDHITVVPNPHYWNRAAITLREIRFYPAESSETEERMFRAGQLHATSRVPPPKIDAYRRDPAGVLLLTPIFGTYYFSLNVRTPPLGDVRVRRALALVLDRKAIVESVTRGDEKPALAFTPGGMGGYPGGAPIEGNADDARRLLAEAGFPAGKGFPKLRLCFNSNELHRAIAEAAQQMWRRELGIEVELVNRELKVHWDSTRRGDYDIARVAWEAVVPDAHDFVEQLRSNSSNNWTGWADGEYDRILADAEKAPTNEERFRLFAQLDAILAREVPIIPLYHHTHPALVHPAVKEWPANAQNYKTFQQIRLQP